MKIYMVFIGGISEGIGIDVGVLSEVQKQHS